MLRLCVQEKQCAVCHHHHSPARVSAVPTASLHVLPAAALPANHAHQNAHRGKFIVLSCTNSFSPETTSGYSLEAEYFFKIKHKLYKVAEFEDSKINEE